MRRKILILLMLCLSLALLAACAEPQEILSAGDIEAHIYTNKNDRAQSIKIYKGNELVDTWNIRSTVGYAEAPLTFTDVNFDGHPDLRILVATGNHLRYSHRIYDAETNTFYSDAALDKMLDVQIDTEQKQIMSHYRTRTIDPAVGSTPETYIDEQGVNTYEWADGELKNIRRECVTYYSESDIYCIADWRLNSDGILEPYDERWMSPEKYEESGYEPIS